MKFNPNDIQYQLGSAIENLRMRFTDCEDEYLSEEALQIRTELILKEINYIIKIYNLELSWELVEETGNIINEFYEGKLFEYENETYWMIDENDYIEGKACEVPVLYIKGNEILIKNIQYGDKCELEEIHCVICLEVKEKYKFNCDTCVSGKICEKCYRHDLICFTKHKEFIKNEIRCPCCRTMNWNIVYSSMIRTLAQNSRCHYYKKNVSKNLHNIYWRRSNENCDELQYKIVQLVNPETHEFERFAVLRKQCKHDEFDMYTLSQYTSPTNFTVLTKNNPYARFNRITLEVIDVY